MTGKLGVIVTDPPELPLYQGSMDSSPIFRAVISKSFPIVSESKCNVRAGYARLKGHLSIHLAEPPAVRKPLSRHRFPCRNVEVTDGQNLRLESWIPTIRRMLFSNGSSAPMLSEAARRADARHQESMCRRVRLSVRLCLKIAAYGLDRGESTIARWW